MTKYRIIPRAVLFIACVAFGSVFAVQGNKATVHTDKQERLKAGEINMMVDLPELADGAKRLEMVLIPAGEFVMGTVKGRAETVHSWPAHTVKISKPFYMAKYEITQAQYEAVMGAQSHRSRYGGKDHPVEKVSWIDCRRFINKLNKISGGGFRLPTEAEWEYACRAGSAGAYVFSDSVDTAGLLQTADKYIWFKENSDGQHHVVGGKEPNAWGLYDMLGNVSEWCADRFQQPFARGAQKDPVYLRPQSLIFAFFTDRINRGGSFYLPLQQCTTHARHREQAFDYHYSLGVRIVRDIPQE